MAVDPDEVDAIAASVADIYREAETALAGLVGRHLAAGLDSPTAERKLGGVRALRRGAQAIISALEADSGTATRQALADAYRHGWTSALADLPARWFPRSGIGQAARAALADTPGFGFVEALAGALHRDFGKVHNNILRDTMDAYRSVQAAAAARIITGAQTRRQAAQSAWARLVSRGITGFTDRAGRRWRLSSYVEMATRTNAQRAATTAQVDRLDTLGVELVSVSDSVQECPLCRPFEGRILRTSPGPLAVEVEHALQDGVMVQVEAYDTLDGARAAGLFHPNCRHSVSAYLPGVSKPKPGQADPEGHKARERQRELERKIRRNKEQAAAALTPEATKAAGAKVRAAQGELRDHLAAHPELKRLRYREQIGAGNIPPAGHADRAGDLGPPNEPTLDGGPATPPPNRTGRRVDEQPPPVDRTPGPGQPTLEEPPPPRQAEDLTALTDAELERRLQVGDVGDFLDLLFRNPEELNRLQDEQARRVAERNRPVADMTDAELETRLVAAMGDDFDEEQFARISAEIDRRDAERLADEQRKAAEQQAAEDRRAAARERARERQDRKAAEQTARMEQLLDAGVDEEEAIADVYGISVEKQRRDSAIANLREQGYAGKGFTELARASYRDYLYRQWLAAENATNGYLVKNAPGAADIDPRSLFHGPEARARKWASDELLGWWDQHGRMTFDEWKAQLTGDSAEARRLREASGGDFLS